MSTDDSDQVVQRRANLAELKALGVDAYPRRFDGGVPVSTLVAEHGSKTAEVLDAAKITTRTAGRILAIRGFGKAGFLQLSDGRGRVQVYVRQDSVSEHDYKVFKLLDIGDWVGVDGYLFRTRTNEFSVHVTSLTFLSKCLLPLPEKWHGLQDIETRYRQRYLDLIVNPDSRRVFEVRSRVVTAFREFLIGRGFLEVETPMMQPMAGGALARPFVTHHNALDMRLFMRIAPELYLKRLTVGGVERVFEINRNFRNEGISTQHNPEFTMLEFYWTYADYNDLMALTEELLQHVALASVGTDQLTFGEHAISLSPPFRRLSLREGARDAASRRLGTTGRRTRISGRRRKRRRWPSGWGSPFSQAAGREESPRRSSRRCARTTSCGRPSSTTFRPRSRRCRSRSLMTPTPWSGSSCTSAALKSRMRSASSTIRSSSVAASRSSSVSARVATKKPTRWTRTTFVRWSMVCRRPAARASASTGSSCC